MASNALITLFALFISDTPFLSHRVSVAYGTFMSFDKRRAVTRLRFISEVTSIDHSIGVGSCFMGSIYATQYNKATTR
jgi:hypothetical protein